MYKKSNLILGVGAQTVLLTCVLFFTACEKTPPSEQTKVTGDVSLSTLYEMIDEGDIDDALMVETIYLSEDEFDYNTEFGTLNHENGTAYYFDGTDRVITTIPITGGQYVTILEPSGSGYNYFSFLYLASVTQYATINNEVVIKTGEVGYYRPDGTLLASFEFDDGDMIAFDEDLTDDLYRSFIGCWGSSMATLFDFENNPDSGIACTFFPIACSGAAAINCAFFVNMSSMPYHY